MVEAVWQNWRTAPIPEKLRLMLGVLEKIALAPDQVTPDDFRSLRKGGISKEAIEDALYISTGFHMINRIADALGFTLSTPEVYHQTALRLMSTGYLASIRDNH